MCFWLHALIRCVASKNAIRRLVFVNYESVSMWWGSVFLVAFAL